MTARDLLTDEVFCQFLARWEEAGRCPWPLADYLQERGLDAQAEAARWAAEEPDRDGWDGFGGVRPMRTFATTLRSWIWSNGGADETPNRYDLPPDVYGCVGPGLYETHAEAVVAFLDAWAEARPAGVTA